MTRAGTSRPVPPALVARAQLTTQHLDLLRHACGVNRHRPRRLWGYRSAYCVAMDNTADVQRLELLRAAGLMAKGPAINGGEDQYYYATKDGARLAGVVHPNLDSGPWGVPQC